MNRKKDILSSINDHCKLENSRSKLNWHLNNKTDLYSELKYQELSTESLDAIFKEPMAKIKSGLKSYNEIVKNAQDHLVFPLEVRSGVYCLLQDQEIVYTGSAKNLINRFSGHFYKEKEFNRLWFDYIDIEEIRRIEAYYIWHLGYPSFNKDAGHNDFLITELLGLAGKLID